MSARIDAAFAGARERKTPLLIAYLCVGDPTLEASFEIARALIEAGADILELGAPFSDPTADGPTIARASQRAIAAGGSMRATIRIGARLRDVSTTPLVLFGYVNPIIVAGEQATIELAATAGIDALLVVDLPAEEGSELRQAARAKGIDVIPLLTPTSSSSRVEAARAGASGFVYYVSTTGVTGAVAGGDPFDAAASSATRLRASLSLPVVVGFGIDDAGKARRAAGLDRADGGADGVVVGSAIVRAIEDARGNVKEACERAASVVRAIRQGLVRA